MSELVNEVKAEVVKVEGEWSTERAMPDWQKIETAPKVHGHEILVICNCPYMMAVVEWLDRITIGDDDDFVSGWYISDGHNDPIWFRANPYMTHWMPLPKPPVTP